MEERGDLLPRRLLPTSDIPDRNDAGTQCQVGETLGLENLHMRSRDTPEQDTDRPECIPTTHPVTPYRLKMNERMNKPDHCLISNKRTECYNT